MPQTGAVQPTCSCPCCVQRQEDTAVKELLHKKKDFICEQRLMKGSLRRVTFKLRERAVLSVLDFYLKHFDEVAVKFFFIYSGRVFRVLSDF